MARRMALARSNPALRRQWAVTREAWADALAVELAQRSGADAPDARLELTAGLGQRILGQAFLVWQASEGQIPLAAVVRDQLRVASELVSQLAAL